MNESSTPTVSVRDAGTRGPLLMMREVQVADDALVLMVTKDPGQAASCWLSVVSGSGATATCEMPVRALEALKIGLGRAATFLGAQKSVQPPLGVSEAAQRPAEASVAWTTAYGRDGRRVDSYVADDDDGRRVTVLAITDDEDAGQPSIELEPQEAEAWHRRALLGHAGLGEVDPEE